MSLYKWSQIANNDATADPSINWAEGQPPSSVNDSARAMMAATAKFRDDIAGAIVTGGTSTAYTLSSYQQFDTLAHMDKMMIAFTPHATNSALGVTINVDGLGVRPIRSAPGAELPAGTLIQGTPYVMLYNNTDSSFYLQGFSGTAYMIPIGSTIEYWAATAPNSAFAFPYGQALSRTTYATLFGLIGTNFGNGLGDGLTFSLPDLRGRVTACPDQFPGSSDASRLTGGNMSGRLSVGGSGGEATHVLTQAEMPAHNHTANVSDPGHTHPQDPQTFIAGTPTQGIQGSGAGSMTHSGTTGSATTGISVSIQNTGGGVAHNVIQPTILCNRIMRVL